MKTILASLLLVGVAAVQAAGPAPEQSANPVSQQPARVLSLWERRTGAVPNPEIDFDQYRKIAAEVAPVRKTRRLTEDQFAIMAAEPGTIVLDARSADKYAMRHIRGAVSLPFTDFTPDSLAKVLPAKDTRVLIYCNNNFTGAPRELATKAGPASLNISTYIALATYGYTNIYELGPLLDVKTTKLPFIGTEVGRQSEQQQAKR